MVVMVCSAFRFAGMDGKMEIELDHTSVRLAGLGGVLFRWSTIFILYLRRSEYLL